MLVKKIKAIISYSVEKIIANNKQEAETTRILTAKHLINSFDYKAPYSSLTDFEFKVFSQWGDDGIIQFIINRLKGKISETFIELGVENYQESNTRFLLQSNNWKGIIVDGSEANIEFVRNSHNYWRHSLAAIAAFITKENVNDLIKTTFKGEVGILSIDIDGNDYWVWKEINIVKPAIVIIEYNSVFGLNPWTTPYIVDFTRNSYHYSNLCYGASLTALNKLAKEKGYSFIGCNSNGNNAYFIEQSLEAYFTILNPVEHLVVSKFRESRNKDGSLTILDGDERLKQLKGVKVFDVEKNQETLIL
jgi:hypothetical protein